jgi:hypothetical protein
MGFKESAYLKYLRGDKSTLTADGMSDQERSALQKMSEIAWNKPTQSKGTLTYEDYPQTGELPYNEIRLGIGRTGVDPRFGNNLTGESYIRREGNTWRVRDRYDFNPNNKALINNGIAANSGLESNHGAALRLIGEAISQREPAKLLSAANPISRLIKGDEFAYPVDIQVPLSPDQLKRLGSNELTYGGQNYTYEPYQFAKGETVEQAVQKAFASNQYKPEGDNLKNYIAKVQQRNKQRGSGDTSYYIPQATRQLPSARLPQKQTGIVNALDLISKHIGNFTGF